jgi:glycosyltransferase involved in cell wall biosynthesis
LPKVLYISYDGMTDPLGQSQVLPYLIGLSKEGYEFQLISFEKKERFEQHKAHIQQICDTHGIQWHPQKYSARSPIFSTVWDISQMKKTAYRLNRLHHFDIVHCRSYISGLVGLAMKKRFNTKFLFDMRGFWADERVDGGLWDLKKPIYKLIYSYFKKKEITFFQQADYTISLTENGKNEILSWKEFQQKPPKIQLIPCCVDTQLFNPEIITPDKKKQLRERLQLKETDYILGYVGSIGTWYMLSEMLDYFKVLVLTKPTAQFLFVSGEKPDTIYSLAAQKNISRENIHITSCLHQEVPVYISLFDTSIFFIRPTYSKKASSPTKQGEIMAMGIPLVCNAGVGDTDQIVKKYQAGTIISTFNNAAYQHAITDQEKTDITRIKQGAKEYYSLENGVNNYLYIYKQIYADKK